MQQGFPTIIIVGGDEEESLAYSEGCFIQVGKYRILCKRHVLLSDTIIGVLFLQNLKYIQ